MPRSVAFVLLAGGQGLRLNQDTPKQFIRVAGKSLLEHSYTALHSYDPLARMVVVVPADAVALAKKLLANQPAAEFVIGGDSRQASTWAALKHLSADPPDTVVIHDAARPFLSAQIVHDVIQALEQHEAVDVAIPTADTIIVERDGFIQSIPKRNHIYRGQTPQGFHFKPLIRSYQEVGESRLAEFTDDCGIYMDCNPMGRVRIVKGSTENIKITEDLDLALADEIFRTRAPRWDPENQGLAVRNKRALIFGGTKGIGNAISRVLQESGASTLEVGRSTGCDITQADQVADSVERAAAQMGGIDFVVNTVGLLLNDRLSAQPLADIDQLIRVNLLGALYVARASHAALARSQGMLLNFSSSSYSRGRANYTPYSASKAAIVNMTQGLAEEWAQDGIRVNCLVPGRTDTSMRRSNFVDEAEQTLLNPYDVALSACKLLSSQATGMTVRV
jgi:2-C-methyl-D-erythritol 4-phosphate cytidylyltransferase